MKIPKEEPKYTTSNLDNEKYKDYSVSKEEPKQIKCYCGHTITCDCSPLEEPKDVVLGYKTSLDAQMLDKIEPKQERSYSEDEVRGMLNDMSHYINTKELKDDDMVQYTEWVKKRDWFCDYLIEKIKKK
jgi:hypothetical protein